MAAANVGLVIDLVGIIVCTVTG